ALIDAGLTYVMPLELGDMNAWCQAIGSIIFFGDIVIPAYNLSAIITYFTERFFQLFIMLIDHWQQACRNPLGFQAIAVVPMQGVKFIFREIFGDMLKISIFKLGKMATIQNSFTSRIEGD